MSKEFSGLSLSPSVTVRALGAMAVLLIVASVGGQIAKFGFGHDHIKGLVRLFSLDREQNIPTYFSVLLILIAAFLLAVTAQLDKNRGIRLWWNWAFLSFGFLLMGYDEAFQVHEQLVDPIGRVLGREMLGVFHFAWVIPGIALVFALMLFVLPFLVQLPRPTRWRFVLAAAIYVGGSIGMEMLDGRFAELHGMDNWRYSFMTTIEEILEMTGVIFFIWALLRHWADKGLEIRVDCHEAPEHTGP